MGSIFFQFGPIHHIDERVADIIDLYAVLRVESGLKGQDAEQPFDVALEEADAPRAPRPYFRRDEVVDRDSEAVRDLRHPEIEFRGVDQHDGIGPQPGHFLFDLRKHVEARGRAVMTSMIPMTESDSTRSRFFLPGAGQVRAPHADGGESGVAFAQGRQQRGGLHIAGKLSGIDPDCFHETSLGAASGCRASPRNRR